MHLNVSLASDPPAVTLEEPEDCKRFHIDASGGDAAALEQALKVAGAGRMDGDDAMVDVAWVRAQAAGRVGDSWAADFDAMLGYARSKGWLDEPGTAIQAHVNWP